MSADDLYVDGVALNLHSMYAGLERLFELIATTLDGVVPEGANWHRLLLDQMVAGWPGVRPAVISMAVRQQLDRYRGFRHIVRNVYAYRFDPAQMADLVADAPAVLAQIEEDLTAFADFLERRCQDQA